MQNVDFKQIGLVPLSRSEKIETQGGFTPLHIFFGIFAALSSLLLGIYCGNKNN